LHACLVIALQNIWSHWQDPLGGCSARHSSIVTE
jgi:hypothetical protein